MDGERARLSHPLVSGEEKLVKEAAYELGEEPEKPRKCLRKE